MSTSFSLILGSIFSFGCLNKIDSEDKLENILNSLDSELTKYSPSTPNNIIIEFPNDFTEYDINGQNFEDLILRLVEDDWGKWQHYMNEVQKIIGRYIEYENTLSLLYKAKNYTNPFPVIYLYVCDSTNIWPDLDKSKYTYNWSHTLTLNSKLISQISYNLDSFVELCRKNFEFIEFHDEILTTIKSIQGADYKAVIETVLHALNVLNQAYHIISTDPNQNLQDLNTIVQLSDSLGLRLDCTRQGSNKVERDFVLPLETKRCGREVINCEYHLKIDNYDGGQPIAQHNKVRIYFGMKSYNELPRKRITIAHIGKHL
ncbi:hypothetical protein KTH76_02115 [Acinetobacter baumannii]|uniref:hypothetical protein n=1 Tax=Acinetobacter baumannii TaxID=470 RepID=UPI0021C06984|nr:hypothetical protein [Acinetobacter baumannii]